MLAPLFAVLLGGAVLALAKTGSPQTGSSSLHLTLMTTTLTRPQVDDTHLSATMRAILAHVTDMGSDPPIHRRREKFLPFASS